MVGMSWTRINSEGSRFATGKYISYALLRIVSEGKEKEYAVKLYSSPDEMKQLRVNEIIHRKLMKQIKLEKKIATWGDNPPQTKIDAMIASLMKKANELEGKYSEDPNLWSQTQGLRDDLDENY
jgi:hypothetical protein